MGQYEPNDSRNVTLKPGHEPGGIERTGPRESETRQQAQQSSGQSQSQSQSQAQSQARTEDQPGEQQPAATPTAQAAYGNSRDEDGQMEQQAIDRSEAQRLQQAERQENLAGNDSD